MFFPRQPWEHLLDNLATVKKDAKTYEQYFNDIISNMRDKGNFQQVSNSKAFATCRKTPYTSWNTCDSSYILSVFVILSFEDLHFDEVCAACVKTIRPKALNFFVK